MRAWLLLCLLMGGSLGAWAAQAKCQARVLSVHFAFDPEPQRSQNGAHALLHPMPPPQGWRAVTLPDIRKQDMPPGMLTGWYRIDWERDCEDARPMAFAFNGIGATGVIYSNDELLWSDESLVEPLSMSWNIPRWWMLPRSLLRDGVNTLWVRVTGYGQLGIGLGVLSLGEPAWVREQYERSTLRLRTAYVMATILSAVVGCIFLVIFLLYRRERAYGWYSLASLLWVLYLVLLLVDSVWPFSSALALSRMNIAVFVLYVASCCQFTWVIGEQHVPRWRRALVVYLVVNLLALAVTADVYLVPVFIGCWGSALLILLANYIQFIFHAWHTRKPRHMLVAACWLVAGIVAVHDVGPLLAGWQGEDTWAWFAAPAITVGMAMMLGAQLGSQMRRIERFNTELAQRVNDARSELAQALEREHRQKLHSAKTQERLDIAHDLHDGLGASLVRSMALVEQARQPLANDRVMSLFKVLRDDLRQVIDHGSSAGATVPATPVQWMAPLRYRFTTIFEDLDITSQWEVPNEWAILPTAVQCLALTRVVEEALSNIIKHSQAGLVSVRCDIHDDGLLTLRIQDDGVGFDVHAVRDAGLSVGLRSMEARAQRLGAAFHAVSRPGETVLTVQLPLAGAGPGSGSGAGSGYGAGSGAEADLERV